MIKEVGEVVRVDGDSVWVQTIRQSTCGSCHARNGCGQKLLNQLSSQTADIRAKFAVDVDKNSFSLGDQVEIGISEGAVVFSSMVSYGLPILSLVIGVAIVAPLGSDVLSAVAGFSALIFSACCVRWLFPKLKSAHVFEPVVLGLSLKTAVESPTNEQVLDAPRKS